MEFQTVKSLEHPKFFLMRDPKVNLHLDQYAVGAERAAKQSMTLLRPVDHEIGTRSCLNVQQASSFGEGDKVNKMAVQYESSLFSSSLSELFSRKSKSFPPFMLLDMEILLIAAISCAFFSNSLYYLHTVDG